jgi:hypothetical protein
MKKDELRLVLALGTTSHECEWSRYALFRDNVQHFIESGKVTSRFSALHSIEMAVMDGSQSVNAARLRGEVLGAIFSLGGLSLDRAAISLRTRAIMTGNTRAPLIRGTALANQVGWGLPISAPGETSVLSVTKPFAVAVLALTAAAEDGDMVEVRREGKPPALAQDGATSSADSGGGHGFGPASFGLAALLLACSATPIRPPASVDETQLQTKQEQLEPNERPPVVAPPPAYGHKVVRVGSVDRTKM